MVQVLFKLEIRNCSSQSITISTFVGIINPQVISESIKWHARLDHIDKEMIARLARDGMLATLTEVDWPVCEYCVKGKAVRKPFPKESRTQSPLEKIHTDICRPLNVKERNKSRFFMVIDNYFRYGYVYLISQKSQAL